MKRIVYALSAVQTVIVALVVVVALQTHADVIAMRESLRPRKSAAVRVAGIGKQFLQPTFGKREVLWVNGR